MEHKLSLLAQLRRELRESIHTGAALAALTCAAGCGGHATPEGDSPVVPDLVTTPTDPDSPPLTPANNPGPALETYALDQLGCFGPSYDGGYYGQCCFDAQCYTPANGVACATAAEIQSSRLIPLPPGSGECGCGNQLGRDAIAGPFAPNTADATASVGSCCYVVGSISCTGRPLVVDGAQLLAPAVQRIDWLSA